MTQSFMIELPEPVATCIRACHAVIGQPGRLGTTNQINPRLHSRPITGIL